MEGIKIYNNIVEQAKKVGVSINKIEEEAGLSKGSLCKWNIVSPSARSLTRVADVIGCDIKILLNKRGNQ